MEVKVKVDAKLTDNEKKTLQKAYEIIRKLYQLAKPHGDYDLLIDMVAVSNKAELEQTLEVLEILSREDVD